MSEPIDTLESLSLTRTFVKRAELLDQAGSALLFRTAAAKTRRRQRPDAEEIEGRLQVDVLADDVFRVRYAEGARVPESDARLIETWPSGPTRVTVEQDDASVTILTPAGRLTLMLRPLAMTVSDGSGREAVTIGGREKNFFNVWDSFNTGVSRPDTDTAAVPALATETFSLHPQEAIYGFGEKFGRLDKVGQTIELDMKEATGVSTPRSYKNIPFWMSTRGYGVFLNTTARVGAWVGSRMAGDLQVAVADDHLDYVVFLGDLPTILDRYTELTGRPRVPPAWSFGFWQSKISYRSAEETLDIARRYRATRIPLDVLHLDTHWFKDDWFCDLEFDTERFPDPAAYLAEMRELGVRVSLWQLPYIPEGSKLFDDLLDVDGFVKTGDGETYDVGICYTPGFSGRVGCIDFTNERAVEVYQSHIERLHRLGAAVIKVDFGEQAPDDAVYADGTPGHLAHNLYPLLYNRAVAEVTERATGERVMWARSAWAGSQRYPLHWGGDSSANWSNLAPQFRGGLSFGLSGFPFWSQDIGGFLGNAGGPLFVRWMQAGMFTSHTRVHGAGTRELDRFEDSVLDICRRFLWLRYRLLPYLLGRAAVDAPRGIPMMRPLVLDHQDDPTTWAIDDQWMFGDALLVAPVMTPDATRRAYLPHGQWTDWWTGARTSGPRWLSLRDVPLDVLPLWVREGGVVALGPVLQHVGERSTDEVVLRLAPWAEAGHTETAVQVDGQLIRITYTADTSGHRVVVRGAPRETEFSVEPLGDVVPAVTMERTT